MVRAARHRIADRRTKPGIDSPGDLAKTEVSGPSGASGVAPSAGMDRVPGLMATSRRIGRKILDDDPLEEEHKAWGGT